MKNILWGILALVLVIVLVFVFKSRDKSVALDNSTDTNATSTNVNTGTSPTTPTAKPASFKSLIALSGNHECKYEQVSQGSRSTNVVYLSNGKLRGEFRTTANGVSTANLMVYDGKNLYVWKEGQSTGTISQPKTIAELPDVIPADITSGAVFGTNVNNASWDCHGWTTVPSLLVKPSYVTFK